MTVSWAFASSPGILDLLVLLETWTLCSWAIKSAKTFKSRFSCRSGFFLLSKDDDEDILESVKKIRQQIPKIVYHESSNLGHFTYNDMKTDKFPELLGYILK
jgi:hypothetical protein